MADGAIVFAMANPTPEVAPEEIEGLAAIVATGRSDYPNQINNVLAFPGIFRGALDVRASTINEEMKLAAAQAIAGGRQAGGARGRLRDPERLQPLGGPVGRGRRRPRRRAVGSGPATPRDAAAGLAAWLRRLYVDITFAAPGSDLAFR